MKALNVSQFHYNEQTGQVSMLLQLPKDSKKSSFYLINHDVPRYAPPKKIPIHASEQSGHQLLATVEFNLDDVLLSKSISNNSVWYLVLETETEQYQCKVEQENFRYFFSKNKHLYKAKPYKTKHNTLAFYICYVEVNVQARSLQYEEGIFKGELKSDIENMDLGTYLVRIGIKERSRNLLQEFDCINPCDLEKGNLKFDIPLAQDLKPFDSNETIFDIYLILKSDNCIMEQKIIVSPNFDHQFKYFKSEINDLIIMKPYKNGENALSLFMKRRNIIPYLSDILFDEELGKLKIEGIVLNSDDEVNSDHFKAVTCILKQRNPIGNTTDYFVEKSVPLNITGKIFTGNFSLEEVFPFEKAYAGNVWDLFIGVRGDKGRIVDYPVKMVANYKSKNYGYYLFNSNKAPKRIKPYITGANNPALYVADDNIIKDNAVKISILGTCYSRNPFNSKPYFNPQYKKLYKLAFTQFHSSLISITSEPTMISDHDLGNLEESYIPFVKRDFSKTFFEDLKNSVPDYFILDLDIDATHNLVKINENQIVTLTFMLAKTNFLKNHQDRLEYILHDDDERYFELWKKAADIFINKLTEIIPPERVILNSVRYAEKYLDSKNKIQTFSNGDWIKERNKLWEKMDYYFLSKLPQARFINLTKTGFIGDESYPFGTEPEPSHYQSGYYKEFLRQLNEIVIGNLDY